MNPSKYSRITAVILVAIFLVLAIIGSVHARNPHRSNTMPLKASASVVETYKSGAKDTGKAVYRWDKKSKTLSISSQSRMIYAGIFSFPEYLVMDPSAFTKDPGLFVLWNQEVGQTDEDMKNALWFAFCPSIRTGKVQRLVDIGNYDFQLGGSQALRKEYRFYAKHGKLLNYDFSDGSARYNVLYQYNQDKTLQSISFRNSNGFSMTFTFLYKDGISCGRRLKLSTNRESFSRYWKSIQNEHGRVTEVRTGGPVYRFQYSRNGKGYLTGYSMTTKKDGKAVSTYRESFRYDTESRPVRLTSIVVQQGRQTAQSRTTFTYADKNI